MKNSMDLRLGKHWFSICFCHIFFALVPWF